MAHGWSRCPITIGSIHVLKNTCKIVLVRAGLNGWATSYHRSTLLHLDYEDETVGFPELALCDILLEGELESLFTQFDDLANLAPGDSSDVLSHTATSTYQPQGLLSDPVCRSDEGDSRLQTGEHHVEDVSSCTIGPSGDYLSKSHPAFGTLQSQCSAERNLTDELETEAHYNLNDKAFPNLESTREIQNPLAAVHKPTRVTPGPEIGSQPLDFCISCQIDKRQVAHPMI